jgi:3-phenylpropionate/cinnamic acid dioxygenase small subunit
MTTLNRSEAEDFLYREARLLDERQYSRWLEMFSPDGTYWIPANHEQTDPAREISLVFDDARRLRDRIARLGSGLAHAQNPPSRTKRLISNVEIDETDAETTMVISAFILYELRRGKERVFAGRYEHGLKRIDGQWRIASKKVVLVNNNEVIDNLTFIV